MRVVFFYGSGASPPQRIPRGRYYWPWVDRARPGLWALLLLSGLSLSSGLGARELGVNEVKAAFLYNFANFVTWPGEAFPSAHAPLRYCILGPSPVRPILGALLQGEVVRGHPLHLEGPDRRDYRHCQVLFVSAAAESGVRLPENAVLTVGETREFLDQGGMIALVPRKRRIHPLIARRAAEAAGIHISSKLLRIATLVGEGP